MAWDFVNRDQLLRQLSTKIQTASPEKRLLLLDSPAGMGKTYLLIETCRRLIKTAYEAGEQAKWKIVLLDFRDPDRHFIDRRAILEDIARQICRDIRWDNVRQLVQKAASGDQDAQILIQQAISIPMGNKTRQALLNTVRDMQPEDLEAICKLIVNAFDDVDLQELRETEDFADPERQVAVLVDFILRKKTQSPDQDLIPDNVLLVFDSLDAIRDEEMRGWVISELALWLHDGLQASFERFFVIACGRFISQNLPHAVKQRYYTDYTLDPFTPEVIEELIRQFGDRRFNRKQHLVSRLARKLSQVCGGHPKVIKDIARRLHDCPGQFSALVHDPLKAGYWYDNPLIGIGPTLVTSRAQAIQGILGGVNGPQELALELLSVFRKFNSATLEILCAQTQSCEQPDDLGRYQSCTEDNAEDLFDNLSLFKRAFGEWHKENNTEDLFNHLLEARLIWHGGLEQFCSGRIVSNLMAAQMQEQQPDLFHLLNEWAVEIFEDWTRGKFTNDPRDLQPVPGPYQLMCVCEWLFHQLRLAKPCCSEKETREFNEQVAQKLNRVLKYIIPFPGQPDSRSQYQAFRRYVAQDQEIDYRIWEIALENPQRYGAIREQILATLSAAIEEEPNAHTG
jgi:hypothetical protein